mmetsp:Transcript_20140/g.33400  ORF Transcript_20140/g.33400 Transcript_20140/m.33400 type:complete len:589 (-) Transcript_20140:285-2051(-)|eukprot:CAMPEP_0119021464 /NCGR_PEP_ID=MMETSP1176-20130426/26050_1 /TAXON_ID=265551 /ORGANISM="Synedropsis recta cf, Strain CCMP1620" /LENGTH=588 /DNA_ID=CAMNT_0006976081 /DNA_START=91 /DNA_END=1857 /DNA_ORIENTATION=+
MMIQRQYLVLALLGGAAVCQGGNDDTFNYKNTDEDDREFGPEDWDRVECDDLDSCKGWPEDWVLGVDWDIEENSCKWCPKGESNCDRHHQSPIEMKRSVAVGSEDTNESYRECIDWHWMKYEDSTCTWQDIREAGAFTIERHALTMRQPFEPVPDGEGEEVISDEELDIGYQLQCNQKGRGRLWGRIDFSKGFNRWWFLSHMDLKIPSEHVQEGKRYSAEVQLHHFYSTSRDWVDPTDNQRNENEMATISIFLEAYDETTVHPFLDRMICEWRNTEEKVREACGLPSVSQYHGCFPNKRGYTPFPTPSPTVSPEPTPAPTTESRRLGEALSRDMLKQTHKNRGNETSSRIGKAYLVMDPENWRPADWTDEEWEIWAEAKSAFDRGVATPTQKAFLGDKEADWVDWTKAKSDYEERADGGDESLTDPERKLLAGDHLHFHNYQFLIDAKTEYYFRYQGTSTIPPCYGEHKTGSRATTNHWRIIKDPLRVSPRQIDELQRLIRDRIDPDRCREDTAAKVGRDGSVNVARPLMETNYVHFKTFCECPNWRSKWPEDKKWCRMTREGRGDYGEDQQFRYETHPYWFDTGGEY